MTGKNSNIVFQPKPTNLLFIDIQGQHFEKLLVLGYAGRGKNCALWYCQCDCGKCITVALYDLRRKDGRHIKSCGCGRRENTTKYAKNKVTHGLTKSRIYTIWQAMKNRCYRPKDKAFYRYGGRGIQVCDKWLESFENFFADMGQPPTLEHTLDRINNNGNYEPSNCRWASREEQANNRRTNILLTFSGKTQSLILWARELHIKPITLQTRIRRLKWSTEKALTTPVNNSAIPKLRSKV